MRAFVVFLALAVVATATKRSEESVKLELDLPNFSLLRDAAHAADAEPFAHSADLVFAVHQGQASFDVVEAVKSTEGWDFSDYETLKSKALYETKTSYTLLPEQEHKVVSLDRQLHASAVREVSASHLLHCHEQEVLSVGDHVIGSSAGAWFKSAPVQASLSSAGFMPRHADAAKHSLVMARRVLSVSDAQEGHCRVVQTESLHPLELFASMRIESTGTRPFHDVQRPFAQQTEGEERKLSVANPDAPIVACSSFKEAATGKSIAAGTVAGVAYNLGTQAGCLQYNYEVGSISYNYDWNRRGAVNRQITLTQGLACTDCYLYTGAGFLVIVQYSTGKFFLAEVKIAGGAGFNVNVAANNPTVSGSTTVPILPAGNWGSINLGTGLAFQYQMGGVSADVVGSGTVQGTGTLVGGAQAQAAAGFMYAGGKTTTPVSTFASYTKPKGSFKFTSIKPLSAMVMVTGRLNVKIVLGGAIGSVSGHMDLTATVNIDHKTSKMGLSASIAAPAADRKLASASAVYSPGMTLPITTTYKNWAPREEHYLFFALLTPSGEEIPVHEERIVTSKSGSGVHTAHWTIPSDSYFATDGNANNAQIVVRSSSLYNRPVKTQPFSLNVYDPTAGIVTYPHNGAAVPTDVPVVVKWDAAKMHYFTQKDGSPLHGHTVKSSQVRFQLTGEKLDASGSVVASSSTRALISGSVDNLGKAVVELPSTFTSKYHRFYIEVHDAAADNVGGWNAGYFTALPSSAQPASAKAVVPSAAKKVNLRAERAMAVVPRKLAQTPERSAADEARDLAACASGFNVGYGATVMGAVDSMTILLFTVPLGYATGIVPMMPVQVICI